MIVDASGLQDVFGFSRRHLDGLIKEGLPIHERGGRGQGRAHKFDTPAVHEWLVERATRHLRAEVEAEAQKTGALPSDWKERKERAGALKAEDELAVARGKLIEVDTIEAAWSRLVTAARNRLLSIAPRLSHTLASMADSYRIEDTIDGEVRAALHELSEWQHEARPAEKRKRGRPRKDDG